MLMDNTVGSSTEVGRREVFLEIVLRVASNGGAPDVNGRRCLLWTYKIIQCLADWSYRTAIGTKFVKLRRLNWRFIQMILNGYRE